ncbi:hypothetical protein C8J56DRAFT_881566 [Mycena floridula]|nr:hypothetical protein C8J56DRAFT_881566 [Mycena floridula]
MNVELSSDRRTRTTKARNLASSTCNLERIRDICAVFFTGLARQTGWKGIPGPDYEDHVENFNDWRTPKWESVIMSFPHPLKLGELLSQHEGQRKERNRKALLRNRLSDDSNLKRRLAIRLKRGRTCHKVEGRAVEPDRLKRKSSSLRPNPGQQRLRRNIPALRLAIHLPRSRIFLLHPISESPVLQLNDQARRSPHCRPRAANEQGTNSISAEGGLPPSSSPFSQLSPAREIAGVELNTARVAEGKGATRRGGICAGSKETVGHQFLGLFDLSEAKN